MTTTTTTTTTTFMLPPEQTVAMIQQFQSELDTLDTIVNTYHGGCRDRLSCSLTEWILNILGEAERFENQLKTLQEQGREVSQDTVNDLLQSRQKRIDQLKDQVLRSEINGPLKNPVIHGGCIWEMRAYQECQFLFPQGSPIAQRPEEAAWQNTPAIHDYANAVIKLFWPQPPTASTEQALVKVKTMSPEELQKRRGQYQKLFNEVIRARQDQEFESALTLSEGRLGQLLVSTFAENSAVLNQSIIDAQASQKKLEHRLQCLEEDHRNRESEIATRYEGKVQVLQQKAEGLEHSLATAIASSQAIAASGQAALQTLENQQHAQLATLQQTAESLETRQHVMTKQMEVADKSRALLEESHTAIKKECEEKNERIGQLENSNMNLQNQVNDLSRRSRGGRGINIAGIIKIKW